MKRICLLNLPIDAMLGETFGRLKYRIRIHNDRVSLNVPPRTAVLQKQRKGNSHSELCEQ